jgi:hypothetical protein
MIKLKDILVEMGSMTIAPVLDLYDQNPQKVSNALFPGKKTKSKDEVEKELRGFDYNEFSQFRDELGVEIEEAERTKAGRKVNKAYLTKNKSAMKGEIDRVAKLSNDDPSAYTKWDADYADKDKKKPYATKKSAATSAYEKRFGKNESINEGDADKALSNKAKATGISKTVLRGVYDKGLAAWKTGHRPGVGQHQWAMARVNSFVTGKGGARKADKGLWKKASKSKKKKSNLEELDLKKIVGTAALAAGLAGSPNIAKAQNQAPVSQSQQQDTSKTATATYAHPNENTARSVATTKARAALATKLGKPEGSISTSTADTKMYKLADGRYECTATVKIN